MNVDELMDPELNGYIIKVVLTNLKECKTNKEAIKFVESEIKKKEREFIESNGRIDIKANIDDLMFVISILSVNKYSILENHWNKRYYVLLKDEVLKIINNYE